MKKFKKLKGFTLVELVITIALVIILSTISVPIYRKYVRDAQLTEGYMLLKQIKDAQFKYYSEYDTFLNSINSSAGAGIYTCNEEVLGIDARTNEYFTWFAVCYGRYQVTDFIAYVTKPSFLCENKKYALCFDFNITTGGTFLEK